MSDTVREVEYQYVLVPDKPGEGARLMADLKKSGVNLLACCGFPAGGSKVQIDLVPDNPEALAKAGSKLGLKLSDRKRAFLVQGQDRLGAVGEAFEKLAAKNIDLVAAQALCAGAGRYGLILWVKPADHDKARQALK